MSEKVLQINFKFNVPRSDYEAAVTPLVEPIAAMPGLLWKVWIINEADQEAGGIYLFKDGDSLDAYLGTDIVAGIVSHPALSDFSVKQFDVMPVQSAISRAPLSEKAAA